MPRPKKAEPAVHGSTKKQFQFMLTVEASDKIDEIAEQMGISRSEVLERAIRAGSLDFAADYQVA